MPRFHAVYICQQCGFRSSQYLGRCPECQSWNSMVEEIEQVASSKSAKSSNRRVSLKPAEIVRLKDVAKSDYARLSSGIGEFDRVLGGGLVPGSLILVSGEPGVGKSTLLTQLALNMADGSVLYVAGEESPKQIKLRSDRIKKDSDLLVLPETDVDAASQAIKDTKPALVIIDSIQTIQTTDLDAAPGSISQVRESSHRLQSLAKSTHIPIVLVGHITKEGTVAGPKTLEHLVDVVLNLEGDPLSNFRILRTTKNRFGATDEVGIFQMEERGLVEVPNPSEIFLENKVTAPGSAVISIINGLRPLLIEVQALVTKTFAPIPRRTATGIDNNRLQLLSAVISKRLHLPLFDQDIFVNATGGVKISEPAADLGIAASIISSYKEQSIDPKAVFIGELGLLGEVRPVRDLKKRVNEAKKLGFTKIYSPENIKSLSELNIKLFSARSKSLD